MTMKLFAKMHGPLFATWSHRVRTPKGHLDNGLGFLSLQGALKLTLMFIRRHLTGLSQTDDIDWLRGDIVTMGVNGYYELANPHLLAELMISSTPARIAEITSTCGRQTGDLPAKRLLNRVPPFRAFKV